MTTSPSLPPTAGLGYQIDQYTLGNGLRLVVNADPTSPGVAVNLWYQVGSRDEALGRTGFAHLFEHLMFQGTWTGVAVGEHLAAIQAAGGSANATTSFDRTNYFETVHPGATELALWLEAQRMEHLMVDQTNLDTQREVVKEEKRQRYDNVPYGDTFEQLFTLAYPQEYPYHHLPIGSMADLDAAQLSDVRSFHEVHYSPDNAVLVLAGNLTTEQAIELAERHFGQIPTRPGRPERTSPGQLPPFTALPTHTVQRDVPRQAQHLVWRIPCSTDQDTLALDLAMDILAGGQAARLHRDLVMERDLVESVSGGTLGLAGQTNLAVLSTRSRDDQDTDRGTAELLIHLDRLASDGPTEEELTRVHAQLERNHLTEMATLDGRADAINEWASLLGRPERINTILAEYATITADQIQQAVRRWLAPEARATLTYQKVSR